MNVFSNPKTIHTISYILPNRENVADVDHSMRNFALMLATHALSLD